jgi:hypothetical protein
MAGEEKHARLAISTLPAWIYSNRAPKVGFRPGLLSRIPQLARLEHSAIILLVDSANFEVKVEIS